MAQYQGLLRENGLGESICKIPNMGREKLHISKLTFIQTIDSTIELISITISTMTSDTNQYYK